MEQSLTLVPTINAIMASPFWNSTAIIILYDDSDGWYDHQMSDIVNPSAVLQAASASNSDQLNAPGVCGHGNPFEGIEGRCGYGPRQPFLIIGPYAKHNFVDHTMADQTSVLRFIEDNWLGGERIGQGSFDAIASPLNQMFDFRQNIQNDLVILNEDTGEVVFASSPAIEAARAYAAGLKTNQ